MYVVRSALRGAHAAQLRVDHRAVVALLVVLVHDLPVGIYDVFVAPFCHESFRLVRGHERFEAGEMTVDRRGVSGCVHEYPTVPLLAGELDETVGRHIEGGGIEARRHPKVSVELVGPGVVRADDDRAVDGRLTAREEFVTAVSAGV